MGILFLKVMDGLCDVVFGDGVIIILMFVSYVGMKVVEVVVYCKVCEFIGDYFGFMGEVDGD